MQDRTITRREVLVGGAAALAAGVTGGAPTLQRAQRPPNIVFILADDLGAGDLSCYGRPDYRTANIDRLCSEGVKLTQAYANSCTCSPTRVALLSGRYQNRLAIGNYDPLPPNSALGFPTDQPTLASTLKSAGYVTSLIGKWHLGERAEDGPRAHGYDEFYGLRGSHIDYHTHGAESLAPRSFIPDLYENETPVRETGYATDLFTQRAVRFIERNRAQPFLLSLHYTAPHWPWQSPSDRGGPRQNDFHYDGGSREIYAAMMASLDAGVGRVLAALAAAEVERDTLVIFTSDNGGERYSYSWPLRGAKFDLWEGGIRVPCLVRWPARIKAGTASDQLVMSMDWLPTFAAIARAEVPGSHPADGIDVLPMISGERSSLERSVFWRTQWAHAARRGHWKYVVERNHEYLFDLSHDAMERANLKLAQPQVFAALQREYNVWQSAMAPIPLDARRPREFYERLEALEPVLPPPGAPPPPPQGK